MNAIERLLAAATLVVTFCACGDGGLTEAANMPVTLDLSIEGTSVSAVTDDLKIRPSDSAGQTADTCPKVNEPATLGGADLPQTEVGSWQGRDPLCLGSWCDTSHCNPSQWGSSATKAAIDTDTTTVTIGEGAGAWKMVVEHAYAQRTLTLTSANSVQPGDTVTFSVSPATDDLVPSAYLPDVTFGTEAYFPSPATATVTYARGTLSFVVPTNIGKGSHAMSFGFALNPHVSSCVGPESCTAEFAPARQLCDPAVGCVTEFGATPFILTVE